MDYQGLIAQAMKAKESAYAPYSRFRVGAALLTKSGRIFTGCNVENVSFSATNCAERTAVFKAVSEGEKEYEAIALNGDNGDYLPPCGICRQVLSEFCEPDIPIIICDGSDSCYNAELAELLPYSFQFNKERDSV